ncbi:Response regulator MprA [Rosistilla oblonga]|uniref:Response regulator MprA n=1 Tax=Rosistilla oblonga TaxID=2527990 RepID=A0A518IVG9_9BACT|nr:response regulator [Rosistilla oblonga]QDV14775.1 Response regulator MprA [Rosistilla oblonga]QDV57077.1 Response regulator MprA [Rosistilla oblonga]
MIDSTGGDSDPNPQTVPTILIADDDRELVAALSRRIMHLGFRVTIAHDAISALVLIKRDRPDMIVLDIHMPAGNGMCVLEMIRSEWTWSDIPVVIVSGGATPSMIQRVRDDNAHFVPKSTGMWPSLQRHITQTLTPFCIGT